MSVLPSVSEVLRRQVYQRVEACMHRLCDAGYLNERWVMPELRFDLTGHAAGQADSRGVLRFNPHYLLQETTHFLHHTVAHEVAHHVDFLRRGRSDHGTHWRQLMQCLGVDDRRTHPYQLPLATVSRLRTFVYRCQCQVLELTSIRHNRQQRALKQERRPLYYCRRCQQPLVYQAAAE